MATSHPTPNNTPVTALTGVGPVLAQKLAKLNIFTVQDILFHLPFRYQDRTHVTPIGLLQPEDYAVIEGEVIDVRVIQKRTRFLQVTLTDHTGTITLIFFHFNPSQQKRFLEEGKFRFFGCAKGYGRELSFIHPEQINLKALSDKHMETGLTPIYPTTEGISQKTLWQLTEQALAFVDKHQHFVEDLLPPHWKKNYVLENLTNALHTVHRPPPDADVKALLEGKHPAQQRLACEELLAHHVSLKQLREQTKQLIAPKLAQDCSLVHQLQKNLPYELTSAQQRVLNEIFNDLQQKSPMQRLVQGDVGSGKTIVAALAALGALADGWQVAYMAPTELLVDQHGENFRQWFEPMNIEVIVMNGKITAANKRKMLERLQQSTPCMVIGTHALFQDAVQFARLGLVIIDEQHRFGVHQRLALRDKGLQTHAQQTLVPHQLIMTATPIPRTLAMTAYADLDYSVIDELPKDRKPIETRIMQNDQRGTLITKMETLCAQGAQVYWVCPLIEESEMLQCQAAELSYQQLREALPQCHIGLVHGKMKSQDKEAVMRAFKNNEVSILVATTVIEVGVDVPNANYMIIENAERLGLAQLHQLRGRVGRGSKESFCLLLYQKPLSFQARFRLQAMRETQDGFMIAQKDLELRGPGEILGTRQTGLMQFRVADLTRDQVWIDRIQALAENWHEAIPNAVPLLIARWLGQQTKYGEV